MAAVIGRGQGLAAQLPGALLAAATLKHDTCISSEQSLAHLAAASGNPSALGRAGRVLPVAVYLSDDEASVMQSVISCLPAVMRVSVCLCCNASG